MKWMYLSYFSVLEDSFKKKMLLGFKDTIFFSHVPRYFFSCEVAYEITPSMCCPNRPTLAHFRTHCGPTSQKVSPPLCYTPVHAVLAVTCLVNVDL